jgi:glycosyltransferase involved in cell wall biosynthesis
MGRWWWHLYELYEKWVLANADSIFFISTAERTYAIDKWGINPSISFILPYGIFVQRSYSKSEKTTSRNQLLAIHSLSEDTKLFLFNGTLDYLPNEDALYIILNELVPRLNQSGLLYKIFICGVQIKPNWEEQLSACPQIIFKGFVENISLYNKGTNAFICPVTLGTGMKTKITDAIAAGQTVIACKKSCEGFDTNLLNQQLIATEDYHWDAFAKLMIDLPINQILETPAAFYKAYHWNNIVQESILSLPK